MRRCAHAPQLSLACGRGHPNYSVSRLPERDRKTAAQTVAQKACACTRG
jgi:hypothetical protein